MSNIEEYYNQAVELARSRGGITCILLQRQFRLNYFRAFVLIKKMQKNGVIENHPTEHGWQVIVKEGE